MDGASDNKGNKGEGCCQLLKRRLRLSPAVAGFPVCLLCLFLALVVTGAVVVVMVTLVVVVILAPGTGEAAGFLIVGIMAEPGLYHQAAVVVFVPAGRVCGEKEGDLYR